MQLMLFTALKIFLLPQVIQVMSILIFDDCTLMYDDDVIIQTVFVR